MQLWPFSVLCNRLNPLESGSIDNGGLAGPEPRSGCLVLLGSKADGLNRTCPACLEKKVGQKTKASRRGNRKVTSKTLVETLVLDGFLLFLALVWFFAFLITLHLLLPFPFLLLFYCRSCIFFRRHKRLCAFRPSVFCNLFLLDSQTYQWQTRRTRADPAHLFFAAPGLLCLFLVRLEEILSRFQL